MTKMMTWLKKHRILVAIMLLVVGAGLLVPLHFAQAIPSLGEALQGFVTWILNMITQLFGYIVSAFAALLNWVFKIQAFTTVPAVQAGWTIARDLANMFFILVLLLIGFATIIRYESYGIKKLLPRLIIVALLVNFSLLLAGVVIDIGNDLGMFFVSGGDTSRELDIGANMMAAIGLQRTGDGETRIDPQLLDDEGIGIPIIRKIMQLVFTIIVGFLFAAMALIMVFRMVFLWILLIFLPLALVASIVPAGAGVWKKWTTNFLNWAFFPAIFGLFLYIGLLVGAAFNNGDIFGSIGSQAFQQGEESVIAFSLKYLLQYIAVVAILFLGLIQANKMGLAGAEGAYNVAIKARGGALKYAGRGAAAPAKFVGRKTATGAKRVGGAGAQALLYRKDQATGRREEMRAGTRIITKIPGFRQALRAPVAVIEQRKERISDAEGNFKKMTTEHLQTLRSGRNSEEKVAIDRVLAERGQLKAQPGVLSEEAIAKTMKVAASIGMQKELVMAAPDIALNQNVQSSITINETIGKLKPKDIEKLSDGVLNRYTAGLAPAQLNHFAEEIGGRWGKAQIEKMSNEGQNQNLQQIEDVLRTLGSNMATRLDRIRNSAAAGGLGNLKFAKWLENSPGGTDTINLT